MIMKESINNLKKYKIICSDDCGCDRAHYYCTMTDQQCETINNFLKLVHDNDYSILELKEEEFVEL